MTTSTSVDVRLAVIEDALRHPLTYAGQAKAFQSSDEALRWKAQAILTALERAEAHR